MQLCSCCGSLHVAQVLGQRTPKGKQEGQGSWMFPNGNVLLSFTPSPVRSNKHNSFFVEIPLGGMSPGDPQNVV